MKPDSREKLRTGYPLILLFIVLAAGILTTGYLSYRNYERQFRIETERQLSAIAELKVNELVQWRKERLGDADDGVGMPQDLDFRKTESLGLQIVNMLAEQIHARVELLTRGGTRFTLTFRESQGQKRT